MNEIRISDVIRAQAKLHDVDIEGITRKAVSHVSSVLKEPIEIDIELKASLLPPITTYYPDRKLAQIYMFPGVFSLKPAIERDNAILYTFNHELYETVMNTPSFLHVVMNSFIEKMIPSFDTSTLRVKSDDDDIDLRLKSSHCVTDIGVDRSIMTNVENMQGFLTYHRFPHYSEIHLLENFNGSIYDFLTIILSQARRACMATEIKPFVKNTHFQSYCSIYTTSFDKIISKNIPADLQDIARSIQKELHKSEPREENILSSVMELKSGIISA